MTMNIIPIATVIVQVQTIPQPPLIGMPSCCTMDISNDAKKKN